KINSVIEKRIAKYLDAVIGSSDYKVSVSASVSREKVEQLQTIYSEGAVGSRQTGSEKLNSSSGSESAGPAASNSGKNYDSQSSSETMLPSYEQKNVTYLPGRITDVTVALAVDKGVPATVSIQQLRESVAAIIGPQATPDKVKITVVDMHEQASSSSSSSQSSNFFGSVNKFFQGGTWSVISKIFSIVAILLGLLLVAVISLNFLSAASNKNYAPEVDPNLSNEFDEVMNDYPDNNSRSYEDYGEGQALAQQEELLREMMSQTNSGAPKSSNAQSNFEFQENPALTAGTDDDKQFDNLLNNFQSVANKQPDILAKKIQVWLDEDNA
ncbi:MAG: hypothetical protein LW817_05960, partial [Candidatus Caenarcaniphilales bacterium]|nr:hypothetical protein [Candidatus Caenarcaniphilales bacterium]